MTPEIIQAQIDIVNAQIALKAAQDAATASVKAAQATLIAAQAALQTARGITPPVPVTPPTLEERLASLQASLLVAQKAQLAQPVQAKPAAAV